MKKDLIDLFFASEKRMKILVLLQSSSFKIDELLELTGDDRAGIHPALKQLKKNHLIEDFKGQYQLTPIGKIMVSKVSPFVDIADFFEGTLEYWGSHDISFIPPELFERMGELKKCKMISPSIEEMFEVNMEFHESCLDSSSCSIATTFFYPHFPKLAHELIEKEIRMRFIITPELLRKIRKDNTEEAKRFARHELVELFVREKEMGFISFGYSDTKVMMSLYTMNKQVDNLHVICDPPTPPKWAEDFYNYLLEDAVPLEEYVSNIRE